MPHQHVMQLQDAVPLGLADIDGHVEQVRRYACPCGYWTVWTGSFPADQAVPYAALVQDYTREQTAPTTAYSAAIRDNNAVLRRQGRRGGLEKNA